MNDPPRCEACGACWPNDIDDGLCIVCTAWNDEYDPADVQPHPCGAHIVQHRHDRYTMRMTTVTEHIPPTVRRVASTVIRRAMGTHVAEVEYGGLHLAITEHGRVAAVLVPVGWYESACQALAVCPEADSGA